MTDHGSCATKPNNPIYNTTEKWVLIGLANPSFAPSDIEDICILRWESHMRLGKTCHVI